VNIIADIVFSEHMFNHVCYSIFFFVKFLMYGQTFIFFVCVSNIIIILYISNPVPFK
jgi:hypothetical protein